MTGARNILITFSVNLLGTKEQAHRIANNVKEKGGPNEVVHGYSQARTAKKSWDKSTGAYFYLGCLHVGLNTCINTVLIPYYLDCQR